MTSLPKAMVNRVSTSRRDRTAIASSIALHLCVLTALIAVPRPSFPVDTPDERVLLMTVTRIAHQPPQRSVAQHRQAPALHVQTNATPPPIMHVAVSNAHAARRLVVATEHRYVPAPPPMSAPSKPEPAPPDAHPLQRAVAMVATKPGPVSPASAPPTASATASSHEDGIGNFSETYPASVDPAARGELLAGVGGSFDIRITVDEDGRATSVEFVRAPADASQREEIRARLLAAHFIPAACNGLRCNGTIELRN